MRCRAKGSLCKEDSKRVEELWKHLTGGADAKAHAAKYAAAKAAKQRYEPPLLPWIARVLDSRFIFRSRVANHAPDVLRELVATRDVLGLLMRPSSFESIEEPLRLLEHFQQQAPVSSSPWQAVLQQLQDWKQQQLTEGQLKAKLESLDGLAYCIDGLHVWLPNTWYQLTATTVGSAAVESLHLTMLWHYMLVWNGCTRSLLSFFPPCLSVQGAGHIILHFFTFPPLALWHSPCFLSPTIHLLLTACMTGVVSVRIHKPLLWACA